MAAQLLPADEGAEWSRVFKEAYDDQDPELIVMNLHQLRAELAGKVEGSESTQKIVKRAAEYLAAAADEV